MNPFEFQGPDFLFFYFVLTAVVLFVAWRVRRWVDGDSAALQSPSTLVSDPYLIAYLRGGGEETMRVALMSLVDRGLIEYRDGRLVTAENVKPEHARRRVEQEILRAYTGGGDPKTLAALSGVASEYEGQLQRLNLLPGSYVKYRRMLLFSVMLAILGGTAAVKTVIGISRGRPVAFLIVFSAVAAILLNKIVHARRTGAGDDFVRSVQRLFAGLRNRAATLRPGGSTGEMTLLAAAFGALNVPSHLFPHMTLLYPPQSPASSSSGCSSSSSCGSSCGGGCGGGGCGGCGS